MQVEWVDGWGRNAAEDTQQHAQIAAAADLYERFVVHFSWTLLINPCSAMPDVLLEQRRITADEYHAMAEAGILGEDDRVELLDGKIIAMSPTGGSHIGSVNRLTRVLVDRTSSDITVSVQNPVRLDLHWEPEPDVALLRPGEPDAVPTADRVLLLIEVADTTLAKDRTVKVPHYARAGIPEVWLVALEEQYVEVYRRPSSDGYAEMRRYGPGEAIAPSQLSAFEALPVDDILGA